MKKVIIPLFLILLSLALVSCEDPTAAPSARSGNSSPEDPTAVAHAFVDLLAQGNFAAAVSKFDPDMKAGLTQQALAETWEAVISQYGPLKKQLSTEKGKAQGFDVVIVKTEFEKGQLSIRVAVNKDKLISGLFFEPV